MNIAILSTFVIEGGAPIAAVRLHKGFQEIDQGSSMIVKVKSVEDKTIHRPTVPNLKNRLEEKAFFLLERKLNRSMRTTLSNTYFSPPYPTLDLTGVDIIRRALWAPIKQLAENAGLDGSIVAQKVFEGGDGNVNFGYDIMKEKYGDMMEFGVIVPTKVERTALQNGASIASLLLTTDAVVSEIPEEKKEAAPGGMPGGGMY